MTIDEPVVDVFAVMAEDGVTIANVVAATADYAAEQGWHGPLSTAPGGPGIGWSTPDGGATWERPPEPPEAPPGGTQ